MFKWLVFVFKYLELINLFCYNFKRIEGSDFVNIDNYEDYFKYKIKTVYQYSILLSKILGIEKNKFWHKKKDIEDSLNYIINDYFSKLWPR